MSHLIQQGHCQHQSQTMGSGVAARRWRQRQTMGRKLLEVEPQGWDSPKVRGARFWTMLRWGGAGFALAWWLATL